MEHLGSHYAILLHDPQLREDLIKQAQQSHVSTTRTNFDRGWRRCCARWPLELIPGRVPGMRRMRRSQRPRAERPTNRSEESVT
jgi:hypothetical protein